MILPIDFAFGLHYIGASVVAVYDLTSDKPAVVHPTLLWSFDPDDRYADVIWCPTTGDIFAPGMRGGKTWEGVS